MLRWRIQLVNGEVAVWGSQHSYLCGGLRRTNDGASRGDSVVAVRGCCFEMSRNVNPHRYILNGWPVERMGNDETRTGGKQRRRTSTEQHRVAVRITVAQLALNNEGETLLPASRGVDSGRVDGWTEEAVARTPSPSALSSLHMEKREETSRAG
ncbi:hypothetical protein FGB62_127g044 [Gracilaria domingensis]|nr:hypothetical protein FGB62_127g044 [Gracilaria domingensis]